MKTKGTSLPESSILHNTHKVDACVVEPHISLPVDLLYCLIKGLKWTMVRRVSWPLVLPFRLKYIERIRDSCTL